MYNIYISRRNIATESSKCMLVDNREKKSYFYHNHILTSSVRHTHTHPRTHTQQ